MCRGIDRYSAVRLFRQSRRIPPTLCGFAAHQALMRHIQTDHGDVCAGMEHTIRSFRILNDICFGGQIPAVAFLGERTAHHHQSELTCDVGRSLQRRVDVGQRAGRNDSDVIAVTADRVDNELHTGRQSGGVPNICSGRGAITGIVVCFALVGCE